MQMDRVALGALAWGACWVVGACVVQHVHTWQGHVSTGQASAQERTLLH